MEYLNTEIMNSNFFMNNQLLDDTSFAMSPESVQSLSSSSVMSPPPHRVPQNEGYVGKFTDNNNYNIYNDNFEMPMLKIVDQPSKMFRFRYWSEMSGTHGCLPGRSRKKSCPTVQLMNYPGKACITCMLVQDNDKRDCHPHRLINWKNDNHDDDDIQEVTVNSKNNFTAKFNNMAIVFTGKKEIGSELMKKMHRGGEFTLEKSTQLKRKYEIQAKNIDLNRVVLMFSAYDYNTRQQLCSPLYSEPIQNSSISSYIMGASTYKSSFSFRNFSKSESAETCPLKIVNISRTVGSCIGGDSVIILVEKVKKKNIQIRFFEMSENERIWEANGNFNEFDVHRQYAIVFRTPPYRDQNVTKDVKVFIELYRPKDKASSNKIEFIYKSNPLIKKRKMDDSAQYSFPEDLQSYLTNNTVASANIPLPVTNLNQSLYNTPMQNFEAPVQFIPNNIEGANYSNTETNSFINELLNTSYSQQTNHMSYGQCYEQYSYNEINLPNNIVKDTAKRSNNKEITFENDENDKEMKLIKERIFKKCKEICDKNDAEILLKINSLFLLSKKYPQNEKITKDLTNCFKDAFLNGINFLHMLIVIDEDDLLESLLNFMVKNEMYDIINSVNQHHETVLHYAVYYRKLDLIQLLISKGCDPNKTDHKGNTAVHLSIITKNYQCLMKLLSINDSTTPLDLEIYNSNGMRPVHLAFIHNSMESVVALKEHGASMDKSINNSGENILHLAVKDGNMDLVIFAMKNIPHLINKFDLSGYTPLHLACFCSKENAPQICKYLLEHGADPFIKFRNLTAIHWANKNENPDVGKIFKEFIPKEVNEDVQLNVDENSDVDEDSDVDENSDSDENSVSEDDFLNEKTIDSVSKMLNESGQWKELAQNLGYHSIISLCEDSENPSRLLLNNIDMDENVKIEDLYEMLMKLGIKDAAEEINKSKNEC